MPQVSQAQVLEALRTVIDPDRKADIVSLNMLAGLVVKDGSVAFAIEVDPERGPLLESLRQAAETAVRKLEGVTAVTAVLTAHNPGGAGAPPAPPRAGTGCGGGGGGGHAHHGHGHGHSHSHAQPEKPGVPGVGAIVAVASGKGGVGKSTTAVNLALAMTVNGLRVGLLDADIYGPSMPRMLGISGRPVSTDGHTLQPLENYGVKVMSMGFMVPDDTPMIWRGPMVQGALQQMLHEVDWGELDVLVVDMPPGTGDAQLTMAQQVPLAGAVIVSTPQDIALLDARKGLNMFRRVDVPVLGVIENMSYFCCPNCGHRSEIFSHGGARHEARMLGTEFLGEIPLHIDIRETSDQGHPIVIAQPDSEHARVYRDIASKVWAKIASPKRASPRIVMD